MLLCASRNSLISVSVLGADDKFDDLELIFQSFQFFLFSRQLRLLNGVYKILLKTVVGHILTKITLCPLILSFSLHIVNITNDTLPAYSPLGMAGKSKVVFKISGNNTHRSKLYS
jgi:hypothetical protein